MLMGLLGQHPFHLHGVSFLLSPFFLFQLIPKPHPPQHTFDVIRGAGSMTYNYANPVRRDVVSTGSGSDNVTIWFVTDNAGRWFLHG